MNRKVRFAETFTQREELKTQAEKAELGEVEDNKEAAGDAEGAENEDGDKKPSKPRRMRVNQEYVKDKV